MAFLLTNFIYPLKEPIKIKYETSDGAFNFVVDKPNKDELQVIIYYIQALINKNKYTVSSFESYLFVNTVVNSSEAKLYKNVIILEDVYNVICEKYKIKSKSKPNYVKEIAKLWVIVRFEGEVNHRAFVDFLQSDHSSKEDYNKLFQVMWNNSKNSRLESQIKKVFYLLTSCDRSSYLNELIFDYENTNKIQDALYYAGEKDLTENGNYDGKYFLETLKYRENKIIFLLNDPDEKRKVDLLCEYLKIVDSNSSDQIILIFLVSAIELLLTNNDKTGEIRKQFILKMGTLIYDHDKSIDLKKIKIELKQIYDERCNVVHGNFKNNPQKIKSDTEKLQYYLKILIKKYVDETEYINFLKDS